MRTLRERFDSKVDRSGGPDACWNWTASITGSGYGQIGRGRAGEGNALSHRLAWELARGPIPETLQVLHRCDNKLCCNPAHFFLGTQLDNIRDMDAKGRGRRPRGRRGIAGPNAKLTDADVVAMRELYATGQADQVELAARFGVGQSTVSSIVRRETWSHL
jgi:hypothetical protein